MFRSGYLVQTCGPPETLSDGRLRWQATLHVTRADQAACNYLLVGFDVPGDIGRLAVQYHVGGAVSAAITNGSGNVIDIGIWDPRGAGFREAGFRGWSGSDRRSFVLGSLHETTPGYVPGPIQPGRWHLVLGLYQIRIDGCDIEVIVEATPLSSLAEGGEAAGAEAVPVQQARESQRGSQSRPVDRLGFLLPVLPGVIRPTSGWYRGDLHTHTHHSDASGSLADLADAARRRGLDFVAVTDHNTNTSWPYLAEVGGDDLLLIPGEEITTYYGHANAWGSSRWHDFRLRSPEAMAQIAAEVRAAGGLFSINHPRRHGPPWELGTAFEFDCVEVWNGWWGWWNDEALALWEALLQAGRRVIAVGGSDRHQGKSDGAQAFLKLGQPTTWVYASELSSAGILAGIRAGRVCVSAEPQGPRVRMEVTSGRGLRAHMGGQLTLEPGAKVEVRVQVLGATGQRLRVLLDGQTWHWHEIKDDDETLAWPLEAPASYVRAQVEEPHPDEASTSPGNRQLLAVSNPVWLLTTEHF